MVKVKNKRNYNLADKVRQKKKVEAQNKKLNPFEVHINKEKFKVLGKKSKNEKGLPGVSRAKAIQKRKETLGTEYKLMNKSNVFLDRRIGEKNNQLSSEERIIARFAAERAKQHTRKNIYNLADDEVLTHRGQTLEDIEKFDDPRSDEEDNDGRPFGGLDDDFVSEGHFGGGVLSKTDSKDGAKSHKDLIEQLIAESKKRKAEKQKLKEQTLDLTEKLDTEWKDLQPVVFKRALVEEKEKEPSLIDKILSKAEKKAEDYDKTMRELKFEKRGTPSDGLKSQEQTTKEELQKIQKLEKEREERMYGNDEKSTTNVPPGKHRSADDLDDNFEMEEPSFMLAYDKDGKPLVAESIFKENSVGEKKVVFNDGISDSSNNGSDEEASNDDDKDSEKNTDDDEDENNDNDEDDDSNGSDSSDDNDSVEDEQKFDNLEDLKESDNDTDNEVDNCEVKKKISSFFDVEDSQGENLKELLSEKTPNQQSTVLSKLIKSYDPALSEKNKELLNKLFASLIRYINDTFSNLTEDNILKSFQILDKLAPHLYDLARMDVVNAKKCVIEILVEKHRDYKRKVKLVPDLDTLIIFKIVSLLYPTSDFRHPVVTPCLVFMSEILRKCRFNDAHSVSRGLFLTAIILEYTVLSKRFVPSSINFLRGLIYLSVNTSILNPVQVVPPFRLRNEKFLVLEEDCSEKLVSYNMTASDLVLNKVDKSFKIRTLLTSSVMVKEIFDNCSDLEAQECLFEPHIQLLKRVDLDLYPTEASKRISETLQYMKEVLEMKTYTPMTRAKKRPKALKLYEPDIQEVFTGSKSARLSKDKAERDKLRHKYKREMKGALREIRRDKSFIASVKIKQKIHSDNIRKDKVKQIYKDASIQQGELNKIKRMK